MTKREKDLVRATRTAFVNADRLAIEETQKAFVMRGAWLQALALETLLDQKA